MPVTAARNVGESSTAYGVPATKAMAAHSRSTARARTANAGRRFSRGQTIATIAGSRTSAVLYFVDVASPHSTPATATRLRVTPLAAHLTLAQKAHTVRNVAGTSVTPKCESRTCRNATARNADASSATRFENSS